MYLIVNLYNKIIGSREWETRGKKLLSLSLNKKPAVQKDVTYLAKVHITSNVDNVCSATRKSTGQGEILLCTVPQESAARKVKRWLRYGDDDDNNVILKSTCQEQILSTGLCENIPLNGDTVTEVNNNCILALDVVQPLQCNSQLVVQKNIH